MTPLLSKSCSWAVAALAFISSAQGSLTSFNIQRKDASVMAAKVPLRLMPLGASITYGVQSSTGNGYREYLYNLLAQDGYSIDMVGSRKHGSMKENEVEGWPGYRIEQVQRKAELAVPSRLPNLFTLNAGTNDAFQNFKVDNAGQRIGELIEYLWQASPGTTVILSTLIINLNATVEARAEKINQQIRKVASEKASEGKRVVLAEMHGSDGPQRGDMSSDGTHPVDKGYEKMAKIWYRSIQKAAEKALIQSPQPIPKATKL